ncbi:MAG: sulfotransferase family 2 domain-containing protein [Phycisphaeraceae bacterium]|nr:sulfotransferase family 2 domain-containing protein [Phycisphaeraceae bacterium]
MASATLNPRDSAPGSALKPHGESSSLGGLRHDDGDGDGDDALTFVPARGLMIFLHVPKTAGTSLSRIVRIKIGLWPPANLLRHSLTFGHYQINPIEDRFEKIASLPAAQQRKIRFFQGHFGFGVHRFLPTPSYYVTMLRDPVERVISSYYQLRRGRDQDALAKDMSLEEFVTCGKNFGRFHVDNGQVRSLTGVDGNPNPAPFAGLTRRDLDQALDNIRRHFAFVGLSERFDESLLLLRDILGWRSCYYAKANVGKNRKPREELPAAAIEMIRRHNELDQALYDQVARRFDALIRQQGDTFQRELRGFQRRNALYGRLAGPLIELLPAAKQLAMKSGAVK